MTHVPAQRPTVQLGEVLHVVEVQPVARHQRIDGGAREVAVVLVVDRVELDVVDHVADVGVLHREHAVVGEQRGEAADEVVDVRDVGHDVVGHDDVGRPVLGPDGVGGLHPEEVDDRGHADGGRCGSGPRRRVDAERPHASREEVAEQVAVVAGDLDGERLRAELAVDDQLLDVRRGVASERVREGREVRVRIIEEVICRQRVADLHERALAAEHDLQRIGGIRRRCICRIDQRVGDRRRAE